MSQDNYSAEKKEILEEADKVYNKALNGIIAKFKEKHMEGKL
jgi:hypothetical protein